jgi:RNA polymerase sigma factor (sigma-70 family)
VDDALARLTPRERAVVRMVADGWTRQRVGEVLGVSESRVSQIVRDSGARIAA